MAEIKSPKIYDPYLGEMYGNILDQYDNPAYNIRLYLKPEENSTASAPADSTSPGTQTNTAAGDSARREQPTAAPQTRSVADKKIVVLAQTGVTGVQIDDLEIETANQNDHGHAAKKGSFTIIQPGGANFLDQIQWARQYLGANEDQMKSFDFPLYLDISFTGYDSDPDNNEEGGDITQIIDTVTYQIRITKIGVTLDNTGSRYSCEFTPAEVAGFADEIYKLPKNITIQGSTITDFLKGDTGLETKYNEALKSLSTEYEFADQIEFNLSALLTATGEQTPTLTTTGATPEKLYIKDQSIPTLGTDQTVETTTVPVFNGEVRPLREVRTEAAGAQDAGKQPEKIIPGAILTLKEGNSIYTVLAQILSMNREFQDRASRLKDLNNPGSNKVDDNQTFVAWFSVHCEIQTISWDKKRNKYAKKYIYTPYLLQDIRSDVALTTRESDFLTETGPVASIENAKITAIATKRLQDLYNAKALCKSYFYTFTGLNDQIINLDIDYNHGITMLVPPKGGFAGDYSVTNAAAVRNGKNSSEDTTGDTQNNSARQRKERESLVGLFNKIRGITDDINTMATAIGRSPDELAGILNDATGASARRLAESLDAATVSNLARSQINDGRDPADTRTTNTEITVTSFGPYTPEVSGYLYAEDFVQPGGALTQEELQAAGLMPTTTRTGTPPNQVQSRSVPSPLNGITSDGPASVLMGYLYRSREGSGFMLKIEMTVRGDPYWLPYTSSGKFEFGKPTPDSTALPAQKKNYFLLTIGTPRTYDYNIDDEDNNTGYWSEKSTSGVFSGLYMPTRWKHRFSGGIFTTILTASKEQSVPLQWIRPVAPGETPVNWEEILKDQDVDAILRAVGISNDKIASSEFGPGDSDTGDGDGPSTYTPAGAGDGEWTKDQAFLDEVDRLARKYNVDANDLLGLMQHESGLSPSIRNSIGCTGLIQFCPDTAGGSYKTIGGERVQLTDLARMSRAEQMRYVEKYYDDVRLPRGATAAQIYTATFLPAYVRENPNFVIARASGPNDAGLNRPDYYNQNKSLDVVDTKRGEITIGELGQVIANARRDIGL
jgi:hypothetical protein